MRMLLGIKPFLGQCNPVLEIRTRTEATHRPSPPVRRDVCGLRHWVFRCLVKGLVSMHYSWGGSPEPGGFSQLDKRRSLPSSGGLVLAGMESCAHAQARRLECGFRHRWTLGRVGTSQR